MRLAIISEYFYPDNSGGTPTDLSELACALKKNHPAVEIDVITSRNVYRSSGTRKALPLQEVWEGVRIRRLRTPKSNRPSLLVRLMFGGWFSWMALLHLLGRRRYDVVLIVTNPPANAMAGWAYSRIRGVPYVYLIHDLYPDIAVALGKIGGQSPGTRLFHRWQKLWLDSARVVVVLGRCMRQHLCTCYQVTPERIRVIASWADPKKIRVSPKENSFRQANRLRGFIVLYAGNFSQYVNFDQILGAARRLAGSPNVLFVLVGDGTRKAEILERVEREALNNVRVFPKVTRTEMNEVLGAADASLVPLDPRMLGLGVPSKLYSIMASGRPVIAIVQPESEVALVINEEQCGINVADGDALALADGITRLQGDGELALRMGQNAWSAMMRRFTLEQAAEKYYAIFTEITAA